MIWIIWRRNTYQSLLSPHLHVRQLRICEWKPSVKSDLRLSTDRQRLGCTSCLLVNSHTFVVIHEWTWGHFCLVLPFTLVWHAPQWESLEEVNSTQPTELLDLLWAASASWIPRDCGAYYQLTESCCSFFHKRRNVQLLTSATDFGILFPLPSAFCVKKFCLSNYLSVPFAHSQHNHSSTFCFQLVLISNGLLASICSQYHQSAWDYPETWGNLDKAGDLPSIQRSLCHSPFQETWDRRRCRDPPLIQHFFEQNDRHARYNGWARPRKIAIVGHLVLKRAVSKTSSQC